MISSLRRYRLYNSLLNVINENIGPAKHKLAKPAHDINLCSIDLEMISPIIMLCIPNYDNCLVLFFFDTDLALVNVWLTLDLLKGLIALGINSTRQQ